MPRGRKGSADRLRREAKLNENNAIGNGFILDPTTGIEYKTNNYYFYDKYLRLVYDNIIAAEQIEAEEKK